ncbi:ras-like protein rasU [Ruditapes philippinarum]|uniref:ras-like protein rasU n=1 Tax=Ruditapes philippinarum TaxID=129788 RepID=UPI00295A9326|nr:ras-like protein rasU [Ruditapes philippinarum]
MATSLKIRQHIQKNGVKVMVLGHEQVGKTTIINNLCSIISDTLQSEGDTFKFMEASLSDMPNLRKLMIGTANAFILTYAVDDDASFDYVTTLINDVQAVKGKNTPVFVVANKMDKETTIQKRIIADCVITIDYECDHFEVCANTGKNIDSIAKKLFDYYGKYLLFPTSIEEEETYAEIEETMTKSSKKLRTTIREFFCIR